MDNELKAKLYEEVKKAESAEKIVELAKANDLEVSIEEAKKLFEELHTSKELSDDELDNVSGGCSEVGSMGEKLASKNNLLIRRAAL